MAAKIIADNLTRTVEVVAESQVRITEGRNFFSFGREREDAGRINHFRHETFDVCSAMFDVIMSSQRNWK
jgi:hypothetical protein